MVYYIKVCKRRPHCIKDVQIIEKLMHIFAQEKGKRGKKMLKKELRKKIQAVIMAAIVTFTTVGAPAVTFADELPGEAVVAEFSDGEEASGNSTGDEFSAGTDVTVQNSVGDDQPSVSADENSDGSTEDGSAEAEDQAAVDAVKKAFDAEFGSLRPIYGTDSNIADTVLARIQNYTLDVDVSKVKVSLESTEDSTYIGTDGTIHYVTDGLGGMGVYSKNISCTFKFTCNSASAVSDRTVTVGWDREYFKGKMQIEADSLTWDSIKGNNESQEEVDSDLTLPGCMGSNARSVWSEITWESSEPDVISIQAPSIDSMIYP